MDSCLWCSPDFPVCFWTQQLALNESTALERWCCCPSGVVVQRRELAALLLTISMSVKVDPCVPLTWGLDPLFHVHVKLFFASLSRMTRPRVEHGAVHNVVRFLSFGKDLPARPLRYAHVAGTVVHVARFRRQIRFVLDDGSGAVGHFVWYLDGTEEENFRLTCRVALGAFMAVLGTMKWHHGEAEITVEKPIFSSDPNTELLWWTEVVRIHREFYCIAGQGTKQD